VLWVIFTYVMQWRLDAGHRQSGNSNCVALKRVSIVLALEEQGRIAVDLALVVKYERYSER